MSPLSSQTTKNSVRTLTVALVLQVEREKNHENNKLKVSVDPFIYPTRAQLYKVIPQDKGKVYLAEAVFE